MKAIKGFILFGFLGALISSCFDAPEFDIVPEISFQKFEFIETPAVAENDTLILYIDFKDGDGDLGFDPNSAEDLEFPYHDSYYYLATGPGKLDSLTTIAVYNSEPPYTPYFLLVSPDDAFKGPLVRDKTRDEPGFEFLPEYNPNSCLNYTTREVLVPATFNAVDETYNITDTLQDELDSLYFLVTEPLYYKSNINHYNIEVEFLVLEGGEFVPFDWFENFCGTFNGRFPLLGNGERPLEGTIRYAMESVAFVPTFSVKTLKLRVRIRDRALHTSNTIESRPFTLSSI